MMVDFHCHILPKMDDGSDSINTSLAMLRAEHTQGVNRVVLTPHFYCEEESIEAFLQRRKKAFSALQTAISDQPHTNDIPELCLGAEVAMSSIGTDGLTTALHFRNKCLAVGVTILSPIPAERC